MSRIKVTAVALVTVAGVMLSASQAWALGYNVGDVFASVGSGLVRQYTNTGTLIQTLDTLHGSFTTGSTFDSSGNFYVTAFGGNAVTRFDSNGVRIGDFGGPYATPESLVFDAAGNLYAGNTGGGIKKFNSAGVLQSTSSTGRVDWFDLAADQTTAYYTTEGTFIGRWNLATNTALPNFASGISGSAFALRILSDGGVLLADSAVIRRFNAAGVEIQTYDIAGSQQWFALNLDPDAVSFWSGDIGSGQACRFNIATGANINCFVTNAPGNLFGLSVFGEITVVNPPPQDGAVPEPASLVLVGSGALGLLAMYRRRNQQKV